MITPNFFSQFFPYPGRGTSWAWFVPAFKQSVQIKWQSGWEMHCRGVIVAKIFSRIQEENWVAKGSSSWRKMILISEIFVMAHKSGISVENLLLARRKQRDGILITNIIINVCRDMIGRKKVFISDTCALLIMNDPKVTNGNLPLWQRAKEMIFIKYIEPISVLWHKHTDSLELHGRPTLALQGRILIHTL